MSIRCALGIHTPETYGSQGRIAAPYHDGVGRSHRTIWFQCERCRKLINAGSVIDAVTSQHKETQG